MTAPVSATELCPRPGCRQKLHRSHDTVSCFFHGTIEEPRRPWDAASDERRYRRRTGATRTHLDERDRRILAGDEAAYESEAPME
ncbi:MAG: hypothetical protein FJ318_06125 [SAR202 cluster bacterium]|nr:hypothetical protein [SAR202 cluster bacterium]